MLQQSSLSCFCISSRVLKLCYQWAIGNYSTHLVECSTPTWVGEHHTKSPQTVDCFCPNRLHQWGCGARTMYFKRCQLCSVSDNWVFLLKRPNHTQLEAHRERRPPWPNQIITPVMPTVSCVWRDVKLPSDNDVTMQCIALVVKGQPQRLWVITCTTIWSCYSYIFCVHIFPPFSAPTREPLHSHAVVCASSQSDRSCLLFVCFCNLWP